jgi:hypothetical protein
MFLKEKKIQKVKHEFLNDGGIKFNTLDLLKAYRTNIMRLAKASKQVNNNEQSEKIYEEICQQEKNITRFGCVFVIESSAPYAYCMTKEKYLKYLRALHVKVMFKEAMAYF